MTARTQVVISVEEPQPGQAQIHVKGPENVFLLLGIIEMGKGQVLAMMQDQPAPPPAIVLAPAGLAGKLRKLGG